MIWVITLIRMVKMKHSEHWLTCDNPTCKKRINTGDNRIIIESSSIFLPKCGGTTLDGDYCSIKCFVEVINQRLYANIKL